MDILHHFDSNGSLKILDTTNEFGNRKKVIAFLEVLHNNMVAINKEYENIMKRLETDRDNEAFKKKSDGLAMLALAHNKLYDIYTKQSY